MGPSTSALSCMKQLLGILSEGLQNRSSLGLESSAVGVSFVHCNVDFWGFALKLFVEFAIGSQASSYPSIYISKSALGGVMVESIALCVWSHRYARGDATVVLVVDAD